MVGSGGAGKGWKLEEPRGWPHEPHTQNQTGPSRGPSQGAQHDWTCPRSPTRRQGLQSSQVRLTSAPHPHQQLRLQHAGRLRAMAVRAAQLMGQFVSAQVGGRARGGLTSQLPTTQPPNCPAAGTPAEHSGHETNVAVIHDRQQGPSKKPSQGQKGPKAERGPARPRCSTSQLKPTTLTPHI